MELKRDRRALRYQISGEGAETVVLIPALGTTYEIWQEQVRALEPHFTVLAYDPAGHSKTGLYPTQPTLSDYAADLRALITASQTQRPHIMGISMGGMIAQQYAISFPDAVASLVLACTASGYSDEQRRQMRQRGDDAETGGMRGIASDRATAWFTEGFWHTHPDSIAWVRSMVEMADPRAYAQAVRAVAQLDTTSHLSEISCPVLVVAADKDGSTPPGAVEILADRIPNATLCVIPDSSHLCNVEKPAEFNALILEFLQSNFGGGPAPWFRGGMNA